jgi:hypothetical protein
MNEMRTEVGGVKEPGQQVTREIRGESRGSALTIAGGGRAAQEREGERRKQQKASEAQGKQARHRESKRARARRKHRKAGGNQGNKSTTKKEPVQRVQSSSGPESRSELESGEDRDGENKATRPFWLFSKSSKMSSRSS